MLTERGIILKIVHIGDNSIRLQIILFNCFQLAQKFKIKQVEMRQNMDGQKDLLSLIDDGSRAREDHSVMMTIEQLEKQCLSCSRCSLRDGCKQVVFGAGSPEAQIMLIGEAPGSSEDQQGIPFVGSCLLYTSRCV